MMNIDNDNVFHDRYLCTSYNVDRNYMSKLDFFFQLIQDAAGNHAYMRECSLPHLMKEQKTWVVLRSVLDIYHYPKWPEYLDVQTWPMPYRKYCCPRGTYIDDAETGLRMAQCFSDWCILDLARGRRPTRPEFLQPRLPVVPSDSKHPMPNFLEKIPMYDQIDGLACLSEGQADKRFFDSDYNGHINNIAYLQWIVECLPYDFLSTHLAAHVDISWNKETHLDDDLHVYIGASDPDAYQNDEALLYTKIVRMEGSEQVTVCSASMVWKKQTSFDSLAI